MSSNKKDPKASPEDKHKLFSISKSDGSIQNTIHNNNNESLFKNNNVKTDDRFNFDRRASSNTCVSQTSSSAAYPQILESLSHFVSIEDLNPAHRKDSDNASIRSVPASNQKVKKRQFFGFIRKKSEEEKLNESKSSSRYFGLNLSKETTGDNGFVSIDPHSMDGIVDPTASQPSSFIEDPHEFVRDKNVFQTSPSSTSLYSSTPLNSNNWKPPESWNFKRKPSLANDDEPVEIQPNLENEQIYYVRIFKTNDTFVTICCKINDKTSDICQMLAKKFHIQDPSKYELFIRKFGKGERMLYTLERPVKILIRLLTDIGYQGNELYDMAREDNSYICRLIYREASMLSTTTSENFPIKSDFEDVSVQGANLETVPVYLYKFADRIRSLDLSYNLLLDVPLDFIQLCMTLSRLILKNNEYERVPDSIYTLKGLKSLDLSNNKIAKLDSGRLHELPDLEKLILCNNQLTRVPNEHVVLSKISVLDLSNNFFESFPLPICNMSKLTYLNMSYNLISDIPVLFGDLTSLETLLFVSNRLVGSLPNCFENLISLTKIDFRNNRLTNIDTLTSLPQVEVARFDNNPIDSLKLIDCSVNQFTLSKTNLSGIEYSSFLCLTELDLRHSKLQVLDPNCFTSMPSLTSLKLSDNRLKSLPGKYLANLVKLEVLQCANNLLDTIPDELFSLPKLLQVDLHNNRIKKLPHTIWNAPALYSFNASSNSLVAFPPPSSPTLPGAFDGPHKLSALTLTHKLRHLVLADNQLTDEVFSPISFLTNLNVLNLSNNVIYEVPSGGLYKLVNLTELYLSGNKIIGFPAEEVERLRHLRLFYLNSNKLSSLPAELRKLKQLVVLDVSTNVLKYNVGNLSFDWNWNCNKELRYLNLTGNSLLKIQKSSLPLCFDKDSSLTDFSELLKLRVLGLTDIEILATKLEQEVSRRVRTYGSIVNNIGLGVSDRLDRTETLLAWDLVVPSFMEKEDETLFGLFDIRPIMDADFKPTGLRIGKFLSDWTTFHLSSKLKRFGNSSDSILKCLRNTFLTLQKELVSTYGNDLMECASVLLAYRRFNTIYFGHIGDTLAVIARMHNKFHLVGQPHLSDDEMEVRRVRDTGGYITTNGLVNGSVDMSRCFGLFQHMPTINANPSLQAYELTSADEFIIIANRNLWATISYRTAVEIARTESGNPSVAAQKLRDFAVAYGADGALLVMVIKVDDLFDQKLQVHRRLTMSKNRPFNSSALNYNSQTFNPIDEDRQYQNGNLRRVRDELQLSRQIPPPTGSLVIAFTYIKDSKSLWENYNDAMTDASRLHDAILRSALKEVEGYEVKNEGDSFMAAFQTVAAAILWCCKVQLNLLLAEWPSKLLELPSGQAIYDSENQHRVLYKGLTVSMGMNIGYPICEQDVHTRRMDYFGPMVNKSARVAGLAKPGQICVSNDIMKVFGEYQDLLGFKIASDTSTTTNDLIHNEELSNIDIERQQLNLEKLRKMGLNVVELGEKKLKGVELPEPLYLIFPKLLAARSHPERLTTAPKPTVEVNITPLDTESSIVRGLGYVCLRLEHTVQAIAYPNRNIQLKDPTLITLHKHMKQSIAESLSFRELFKSLDNICSRIENCVNTLILCSEQEDCSIEEVINAIRIYLKALNQYSEFEAESEKNGFNFLQTPKYSNLKIQEF